MSKKKSLGSSPIGYSSLGVDSFEFIPSIELASDTESNRDEDSYSNGNGRNVQTFARDAYDSLFSNTSDSQKEETEQVEKKIVSYYLEEDLINRLKKVADENKMFYSTLVSNAIYFWLEQNSY